MQKKKTNLIILVLLILFVSSACSRDDSAPDPIDIGHEDCAYCRMKIVDKRYGGKIITDKGKSFSFDSIECLMKYQAQHIDILGKEYVVNFARPGELISSDNASFAALESRTSPMGSGYIALSANDNAEIVLKEKAQRIMNWEELVKTLNK